MRSVLFRYGTHASDFRKVRLKRQVLDFGPLDPNVAVCRSMKLYEGHASLAFRQPGPATDALRERAGAIDMFLSNERGLDVPGDIRHLSPSAWRTRHVPADFGGESWASFGRAKASLLRPPVYGRSLPYMQARRRARHMDESQDLRGRPSFPVSRLPVPAHCAKWSAISLTSGKPFFT